MIQSCGRIVCLGDCSREVRRGTRLDLCEEMFVSKDILFHCLILRYSDVN